MSSLMTVTIRLSEGKLREISVIGTDEKRSVLLRMSHNARHMPYSAVVRTDAGLEVFQLTRNSPGKIHRISHYADVIREDLKNNYGLTFDAIVWGAPTVATIDGEEWLAFSDRPIISRSGKLSDYFRQALSEHSAEGLDPERVFGFAQSIFRNIAA